MRSSFAVAIGAALALALTIVLPPCAPAAQLADAAPAPAQAAAPLPTVEVRPRPVHTVPDYVAPAAPVIWHERPGRDLTRRAPQVAARRAPPPAPRRMPTLVISGAARLGAQLSLEVRGRSLPLFGVRLPATGDRCPAESSRALRPCGELARALLDARLRGGASVSCRVPPGQRFHRDAAICLDSSGVDLGGLLVGEGLALADRSESYDYVGAEGVARSLHRGLWRYR
jgi:endonuclease YncB( thermonuclease family)